MPKTRAPYPAEFRQQIVELAQAGRTPAELSREFGPSAQTISNWLADAARDKGKAVRGRALKDNGEHDELVRLRRENRQLKMERDILAKATAWFARRTDASSSNSSNS